ncbi:MULTISPECIES: hypothetical protein [unclassified Acidocella]|uniref:hypothetical protein n=1 Tax=unclassified Acidocella TaxID=2648610 RepID=UPI00028F0A09|nr:MULTISPECIES: hypothetical protein [unclassified Acidocella]EKN01090.1 hypothetical protein MXAZACID_02254 [Acidocella sp. MX-AZ02]WBO60582.1 hypothetical protein GT370_07365 [Acidocella sp. MX-AZ03]
MLRLAAIITFAFVPVAAAAGGLKICAANEDPADWAAEWSRGPIIVPAGAIFTYGGDLAGAKLENPPSAARYDAKSHQAAATLHALTLTKKHPCGTVQADVVISPSWSWSVSPIIGDNQDYYYIYGTIQTGKVSTLFDDSTAFGNIAQFGRIYASVDGVLTHEIYIAD